MLFETVIVYKVKMFIVGPDESTVNEIGHICISQSHREYLMDVRPIRGADLVLTDHYLVRAKVRVKMKKTIKL